MTELSARYAADRRVVERYWISCLMFTVLVGVNEAGLIVETAPLVRRFDSQILGNLLAWAARLGGLRVVKLDEWPPAGAMGGGA